jgi:autotransporter-associated beta strand protein
LGKSGSGTLTLSGANTYSGATVINAGTLRLSNSAPVTPATALASYSFANVSGNTVINGGSGGAGMNGTLNLNGGTGSINTTAGPGAGLGALILNGNGATVDVNIRRDKSQQHLDVDRLRVGQNHSSRRHNPPQGRRNQLELRVFNVLPRRRQRHRFGGCSRRGPMGRRMARRIDRVNDGNWHLITYTNAAGAKTIYVDGVADILSQQEFNNTDTGSKIRIGFSPAGEGDGNVVPNASLSGINIYNAALTPQQVAAMYSAIAGNTPLPTSTDVTIAAGATLDVNGVIQQIGSLSGPAGSAVTLGAGRLVVSSANSTQFAGTISGNGGSLVKSGASTLTLAGANNYTGSTTVNAGMLKLERNLTTSAAVNVVGGTVEVASGGGSNRVLKTPSVTIGPAGRIDLRDNKLITDTPVGTFSGGAYTGVQGEVARAYDFGSWDLPGLTTSMPDAGPTVGTTTIGVSDGASILFLGPTETGMFAGQTVTGASTIAMYTYAGDVNFDGLVDASDYGIIDNYFQFPGTTGYANGDFNYDGVIDAGDYGIIDNTFQLQGAPIPTGAGDSALGIVAVPEPTSVSILALAAAARLLGRRRRR